jgi:hypothetical protein
MQDKELYQPILGLTSPWTVSGVKWNIPAEEITVLIARKNSQSRSVSSARFRHWIDPGFSEACGKLEVVDLTGALGIGQSLQVLTRLESLRMVVLSLSDVRDEGAH